MTLASTIAKAVGALGLISVAGCASFDASRVERMHPIEVKSAPQVLEVPLQPADPAHNRRIEQFARSYLAGAQGPITIAYPNSLPKEISDGLVTKTAKTLAAVGVPAKEILRGPYDATAEKFTGLVLSFDALGAFGAGCPQKWGDPTSDIFNRTSPRFGCSVQQNLAAMIERPTDLQGPRPATPADARRRQTVIEAYRAGESTAAKQDAEKTDTSKK